VSYDLLFKPRAGSFESSRFNEYFSQRPHYKVAGGQAWYENEDTGVYFVFELQNEAEHEEGEYFPVALNVNYFRPSSFGLEAEPEVKAFVDAFDMTVSDPQTHGMGDGEYSSKLFLSGWNHGNEFGYAAILRDPANRENLISLPTDELLGAWSWNRARNGLQQELGESKFVPRIMFVLIDGQPATAAVWPDGIPIAVPRVNYFFVPRKELAPRRFLRRVEDQTLVSQAQVLPIFSRFAIERPDGILVLNYVNAPREIRAFVEGLPTDKREITGVSADKVLNRELVGKYVV
jgi:hypothetical protein